MSLPENARLESDAQRHLVGFRETLTMAEAPQKCPALRARLGPQLPLPRQVGQVAYGVNCKTDMTAGTFEYMAAVEVPQFVEGEAWDRLILPASRYLVFTHEGGVSELGDTYRQIFSSWVPQSGQAMAEAPIFERYGPGFDAGAGAGDITIWVPITG